MKKIKSTRFWIGTALLIALFLVPFIPSMQSYVSIPNQIVTLNNESPIEVPTMGTSINVDGNESVQAIDSSTFFPKDTGQSELTYKYAGIPIKKVDLSVLEDKKVIPGGQSVGIQLHTLGVLVVGHHLVNTKDGTVSPGEEADINVGDIIVKINGNNINDMKEVKPYVEKAGEKGNALDVTLKRGKKEINTTLNPTKDKKVDEFKIGLYIRDSAAGIGTMTFFDPETKKYGALGHVISDMDTKKPIEIHEGTIVGSSVTSIERGNNGTPGEKQAKFSTKENKLGSITKNSPFGVFGELEKNIKNNKYDKPMSIALSHEVKEGPAKILTVINDEEVEEFDVKVVSSTPQKSPATKGMVIQITDPKLLEATGGIVQGMSGSPIIQDDKVIGAVTHVFVNDPTSGYGVHIEWMMQEAGLDIFKEEIAS